MNTLEEVLTEHEFLKDLDPSYVKNLAVCASIQEFSPGQFLFRQGQTASRFYLIRSGEVSIELFSATGGPVVIQKAGKGTVIGWSWLIPPYQWRFDARAVEKTETITLDASSLRSTFDLHPAFGYEILRKFIVIIADRLESERLQLVGLFAAHS